MADTYTTRQGMDARAALRADLGLGEEALPAEDLVRMLGDEIAAHRAAGRSWDAIARRIREAAGAAPGAAEIERLHQQGGGRG